MTSFPKRFSDHLKPIFASVYSDCEERGVEFDGEDAHVLLFEFPSETDTILTSHKSEGRFERTATEALRQVSSVTKLLCGVVANQPDSG